MHGLKENVYIKLIEKRQRKRKKIQKKDIRLPPTWIHGLGGLLPKNQNFSVGRSPVWCVSVKGL